MSNTTPIENFQKDVTQNIRNNSLNDEWKSHSLSWLKTAFKEKYMYNFSCLGRPIIQLPTDMIAIQELIWSIKPDLIIETGIAHGGSLIMHAAFLGLLDDCNLLQENKSKENYKTRTVVGVDIEIREHNRIEIEKHPLSKRIKMIEGSSIDDSVFKKVESIASNYENIMVILDSNHTKSHVLSELNLYAPLVSVGSYCVVFDTIIEDLPDSLFPDRPWGVGNNGKNAVWDYVKQNDNFIIDKSITDKLMITAAPDGFLRREK